MAALCCCLQNVLYGAGGGDFCVYFTNWTFVAFGLTGLLGVAVTARVSETQAQRNSAILCPSKQRPNLVPSSPTGGSSCRWS